MTCLALHSTTSGRPPGNSSGMSGRACSLWQTQSLCLQRKAGGAAAQFELSILPYHFLFPSGCRGLHSLNAFSAGSQHPWAGSSGSLLLFGGAPQRGPMLDDLWQLRLDSMQWEQLRPQGPAPHPRCSQATAVQDGQLVIFSGSYYK